MNRLEDRKKTGWEKAGKQLIKWATWMQIRKNRKNSQTETLKHNAYEKEEEERNKGFCQ